MAADIFAKIGDIKGESLDSKHKDEVEVLSLVLGRDEVRHRSAGAAEAGAARRLSTISTSPITSTRRRRFC